eukprot:SAG11_NODE_907_length_6599_cov_13.219231_5_plen_245_part_00
MPLHRNGHGQPLVYKATKWAIAFVGSRRPRCDFLVHDSYESEEPAAVTMSWSPTAGAICKSCGASIIMMGGLLWSVVRAVLAFVPVGEDIYYVARVGVGSWHPMGLRAAKHAYVFNTSNHTTVTAEMFPDTGYNLIALPVHWMGLQAFWFLRAAQTMKTWRALTKLFEETNNTHSLKFLLIWMLLLFVALIYCLRFTTWHLCFLPFVCGKHSALDNLRRWRTPELSWVFSDPNPNPVMEVTIGA